MASKSTILKENRGQFTFKTIKNQCPHLGLTWSEFFFIGLRELGKFFNREIVWTASVRHCEAFPVIEALSKNAWTRAGLWVEKAEATCICQRIDPISDCFPTRRDRSGLLHLTSRLPLQWRVTQVSNRTCPSDNTCASRGSNWSTRYKRGLTPKP